jgi:ABC-2 type transport system ATP-binding protein
MVSSPVAVDTDRSAALSVVGLSKTYRYGLLFRTRRVGIAELAFRVLPGEVFGCLGPNGSGKTTILKCLLGIIRPDAGQISILGRPHEDATWKGRCGFLPENPYFYDYLTPIEYLDYAGRLLGLSAAVRRERGAELLERLGLQRVRDVAVRRFSKGMVQRLGLAQALINDPDLVFLDEPMSGLDPLGRHLVREVILSLKRAGKTVFFSTHILPDAESLCDRVAVLRAGRLVNVGRLDEILRLDVSHVELLVSGLTREQVQPFAPQAQSIGERLRLEIEEAQVGSVLRQVDAAGGRILSVQPIRQSLEEFFVREMGAGEASGRWSMDD